jgi:hypothetical protein
MVRLSLFSGENCRLRLPVRTPQKADADLPAFPEAEISPPLRVSRIRAPKRQNTVARDWVDGWITMTQVNDEGRLWFLDNDLETDHTSTEIFKVKEGNPLSTSQHIRAVSEFRRADWRVRVETESVLKADAYQFYLTSQMNAYEGDERVFTKFWNRTIPRDFL